MQFSKGLDAKDIYTLEWHSRSPHPIIIENVCGFMVKEACKNGMQYSIAQFFLAFARKNWAILYSKGFYNLRWATMGFFYKLHCSIQHYYISIIQKKHSMIEY